MSKQLIVPFLACASVLLAHWKFVDLFFTDRGGLRWFWMFKPVSKLIVAARLTFLIALLFASLTIIEPMLKVAAAVSVISFGLHYLMLAIIE